jgi:penicillin-binding protein 1A
MPAGSVGGFGGGPPRGQYFWLPTAAKVALIVAVAGGAFLGSSSAYINFAATLPDAHAIAAEPIPEDSIIYAADGTQLADVHTNGLQHYYEPLNTMGHWLPAATIAIEDTNFYHEPGVDPVGIARAAWVDWRSHSAQQGASTITQQLVKLRLLDNSPTIDRKVKEAYLAIQVERTYSKQQILEMYLNTIFYGNNSQGSLAASRIYFHKDTKDLDLAEASMLAGIPQSPLFNSPFNNWAQSKNRQREVLNAMVRNHTVTAAEADQAYNEDLNPSNGKMFRPGPIILHAPGFSNWIINQLVTKYGRKAVEGGGMRVYTTLSMQIQAIAESTMLGNLNNQRWRGANQSAMTAIDPHTGAIVAMVGAADPNGAGGQYNFAADVARNPGSSFKIFNYTAGIASGKWTMTSRVDDSPIQIKQPDGTMWKPQNYGNHFYGSVQFQQAMGNSLNIDAVKVELATGIDKVVEMARAMGAPPLVTHSAKNPDGTYATWYTNDDPVDTFGPSLTLGGYGETPLQMAQGASVLAAQGILHPAFGISRITASDGTDIFKADPASQAKQVLDPKVAYIMETIMSDDNNRAMVFGRGSPLTLPGRQVAAKTGTTDNFTNGWTVGYTPDLVAAVWIGQDKSQPMVDGSDAVFVAAPGWHAFMQQALDAWQKPNTWFSEPPGLTHANNALYLPGTSPSTPSPPLPPGVQQLAGPKPSPSPSPGG